MRTSLISLVTLTMLCASLSSHATEELGVSADSPSSSPSGIEVAFSADYDGYANLWIASIDGKTLHKLTDGENTYENPSWSPDGQRIAFSSRNGETSDIWVIDKGGVNLSRLTSNASNNRQPVWSPDGTKIAFVSDRIGSTNDIWIMNSDGAEQKRVTTLPGQENHPSFSPSGSEIVFSHTVEQAALKIVRTDGTGLRTLTSGSSRDWNPSWSKYGIVFSAQRSSELSKIWVIQSDGTGLRQVGDVPATDPVWLPDGRIAFSNASEGSKALSAVSVLNPTSGAMLLVTTVQGYLTPIDIWPGKALNRINPKSGGKVSVAILSHAGFDPFASVNKNTLTFGRTGSENSLLSCGAKLQDINSDRQPDLICRFSIRATGIQAGDTTGILRFIDTADIPYEGRDTVMTVSGDGPDDFKNED